jgi:hypothetical protein
MRYFALILCVIAVNGLAQPNDSSAQHKDCPADQTCISASSQDNKKPEAHTDTSDNRSPWLYAALKNPDWWLVIIAGLTGIAVAYQAREMKRATEATGVQATHMAGQLTEMQESRKIENKTLILQYRPKIIVRNVKALQFSFELGEPGECEIRFILVNTGGSPAYISQGSYVKLMSCIAHDIGNIQFKDGDAFLIQPFTLQPGEQVIIEETLPTGFQNDLQWENFKQGIKTDPLRYLFFGGNIYYSDDLNIPRSTGISRGYHPENKKFTAREGEEEEYTD